jgi:ankyrin repeat protein
MFAPIIQEGNLKKLRRKLKEKHLNCFLNRDGDTALHLSAYYGQVDILTWLLSVKGINVNLRCKCKLTPRHCACRAGEAMCVELLLRAGAELEASDQWRSTPLRSALQHKDDKYQACVRVLLDAGADLSVIDEANMVLPDEETSLFL